MYNRLIVKSLFPMVVNLLMSYVCYAICRIAFFCENWDAFICDINLGVLWKMTCGAILFDTSAVFYTNSLYLILFLLPLHIKDGISCQSTARWTTHVWQAVTRWAYILPNVICIVINLADTVYFSYTNRRIMANTFDEFQNESNLLGILAGEFLIHWYFVVLLLILVYGLYRYYRNADPVENTTLQCYYLVKTTLFIIAVPLILCAMRGSLFTTATRPISVSNAMQYVNKPLQCNIVLNTPFALIRTAKNKPIKTPTYFKSQKQLDAVFSPVHVPDTACRQKKKNVVILIVESFAQEFVGELNHNLDGGRYSGYTTFTDSLIRQSLVFEQSFCNTWTSIDAMPAVIASIPKMSQPFVLTSFSLNRLNTIVSCLGKWGYESAFFHGAENSSMGFHAFADASGYQRYYGRTEYEADNKYGGKGDFDGKWGIWDEPFLQYFCYKISEMKQPFISTVFTLTSHHPFKIPEKYRNVYPDEGKHKLHKCIRYTDNALRKFFATAKLQPWYKNTLFVITADHASSKTTHDIYQTELGHFRIPIIFFDPSGDMPIGRRAGIAQQIDIFPTVLGYLGYDKPYIAFGKNLLATRPEDTWAFNWHTIPQIVMGDYLMQFDPYKGVTAIYDYVKDPLLKNDIHRNVNIPERYRMEQLIKAILQSYNERMSRNEMSL